jgi:hypothetical protein
MDRRWSQWRCGLRHEPFSPTWTLGSWVRIPLEALMSVCVYSVFVWSCVGSGLTTSWLPVQGVILTVYRIKTLKKAAKVQRAVKSWRKKKYFLTDGFSTFDYISLNGRLNTEYRSRNNVERRNHDVIRGTIQPFAWEELRKPPKTSATILIVVPDIRTAYLRISTPSEPSSTVIYKCQILG